MVGQRLEVKLSIIKAIVDFQFQKRSLVYVFRMHVLCWDHVRVHHHLILQHAK